MEKIRMYKFKSKYINNFFWDNNIFFLKAKGVNNKITWTEVKRNKQNSIAIVIDEKVKNIKRSKKLREIIFKEIEHIKKSDCYYTNLRLNFNNEKVVILSNKMQIKITPIDKKIKNALIVYNYFKIIDIIEKQGFDTFYNQYKVASANETQDQLLKHVKGKIDDYFQIVTLKNIIRIYKKESNLDFDYNNPSFKDKMLFEYLNNYFSKFVVITYNEEKIKKFISKYYVTEEQTKDQIWKFIKDFIQFYQIITNNKFSYKNSYNFKLKECLRFNTRKASSIKYDKFYIYFDKEMENINNYHSFMFILEVLDFNGNISNKKSIIGYISVLELLLVHGDRNISTQLQNKCVSLFNRKKYNCEEIKLAYDYRSKIIHGEYEESTKKLHKLALLECYRFSKKELEYEIYLNFDQMLEERLRKRLFKIIKIALKYFIFDNQKLAIIKSAI